MSDFLELIAGGIKIFEEKDPSTLTVAGTPYLGTSIPLEANESLEIGFRNKKRARGITLRKAIYAGPPVIGTLCDIDGVLMRVIHWTEDGASFDIFCEDRSK